MAFTLIYNNLQNTWPFSTLKFDDIKASNELVRKLPIPERTKQYVFAVQEPESRSTLYILSAQNLSEQSALDAECLIRGVKPDAVVVQVGNLGVTEILREEGKFGGDDGNHVPTSSFEVVKRCFFDKVNKEKYENVAGNLVLKEIFGVSFHGHVLAAKQVAKEMGSSFLVLESPFVKISDGGNKEFDVGNSFQGLFSSLVSQNVGKVAVSCSKRFCIVDDIQLQMVKSLTSGMNLSMSKLDHMKVVSNAELQNFEPGRNYEVPSFAKSIYPLLTDLHDIFVDLPSIGRALAHARKMLLDIHCGKDVETHLLPVIYTFQIAVEGLRIALNNAGRLPLNRTGKAGKSKPGFSELPVEEKSHVLLAQALRAQTKRFKTVVAVVDATGLAGLRKHWNTDVPLDVKDLVGELVINFEDDEEVLPNLDKKQLLTKKPVVAVGAGATAVLWASSFYKTVPASTFMKVMTFKVPTSAKLILTHTYKAVAMAISKGIGPSKVVAPGIASSGAKTSSILKATASASKIRAVTHSIIASVEKTSFSTMRTAFYEIMRKRRIQPIGVLPWATFGCSIATCTGLLVYGDGIECAVESLPAAPSIASLGRGIQSLHQASQQARQADRTWLQSSVESLAYRLKKAKVQ